MKKKLLITLLMLFVVISTEGKKISTGRGSSRGNSRKSYNPSPTSLSYPQPSAPKPVNPKPSLSGWQEKPVQRTQTSQSKPSNTHSYPSSQTGLSGNSPAKPSTHQESIQRSNVPQSYSGQQAQPKPNNQPSHSYPSSSSGLSGNSGSAAGYPQGSGGLSGSGAAAPPSYSGAGNHQGPPPSYSNANSYPKQQGSGLSGTGAAAPPTYGAGNYPSNNYGNNYHHPAPPPPYSNNHGGYGGYGGYGGHQGSYNPVQTPQMPGYFGNYGNQGRGYGGMSRGSALTGVGIAGAGVGTLLTGLALWNLARSTGNRHHTVIYDNRGQPVAVAPENSTAPAVDPILGDLVNCTLTISNDNATEVLAIPCAIATSFTPEADVKDASSINNQNDNTKCTITVVTKAGREFLTTIPCSTLLNTAAENNVTEPPLLLNNGTDFINQTMVSPGTMENLNGTISSSQPLSLELSGETKISTSNTSLNCTPEPGDVRDPINPCFAVVQNLTVIPIEPTESIPMSTPSSA